MRSAVLGGGEPVRASRSLVRRTRIEFEALVELVSFTQTFTGACPGAVGRELAEALGLAAGRATIQRAALDMAAISFVLAHNHPSGDPTPTGEDPAMTHELRHLSHELNVPLQAHVFVTPSGRYAAGVA